MHATVSQVREKQQQADDDVMVISNETGRHFIDLLGDALVLCTMLGRVRPARVSTDEERSGFEGSNLAAGSDEGRNETLVCQVFIMRNVSCRFGRIRGNIIRKDKNVLLG